MSWGLGHIKKDFAILKSHPIIEIDGFMFEIAWKRSKSDKLMATITIKAPENTPYHGGIYKLNAKYFPMFDISFDLLSYIHIHAIYEMFQRREQKCFYVIVRGVKKMIGEIKITII